MTASAPTDKLPDSPVWQNSGPHDSSDCDSSTDNFTSGQTVSNATDNKYYCFKVTNKFGVDGYGEIQVDLTPPTINLAQSGRIIKASSSDPDQLAYFVSSTDPDCTASNTTSSYIDGHKTGNMNEQEWVCFKTTNSYNIANYVKLQVDLTKPVITLVQNQTTVTASGTNLSDFVHLKTSSRYHCGTNFYQEGYGNYFGAQSGSVVSDLSNKQWVCFSAKNSLGVYGYSRLMVNLSPTVIESQQTGLTVVVKGLSLNPSLSYSGLFGESISLDGDRLAVGSYNEDSIGDNRNGAVYIFKRTGSAWMLEQKISSRTAGLTVLKFWDLFGRSVSLDGDRLAVGAPWR